MKIGMKEEMGVADKMISSVLGARAHSARICARSTQIHSFSWFLEEKLKLALSEVIKIGMKEEMGVADKMTSSVLIMTTHHAHLLTRSAQINSFSWYVEKRGS